MAKLLPNEILQEIFKYNSFDAKSLYSCLLVNKSWSFNAVLILWVRPFHLQNSYRIIATYLSFMNSDDELILDLKEYDFSSSNSSPIYNYPSFLQHLSYQSFRFSLLEWCKYNHNASYRKFFKAIFYILAKRSPNLKSLDFTNDYYDSKFDFNYHGLSVLTESDDVNWISNVEEIVLGGDFVSDPYFLNIINFCNKIKKIDIRLPEFNYDDPEYYNYSVEKTAHLIKLQQNQQNLSHFTFRESHYSKSIGDALKKIKSLRHVNFIETVFYNSCQLNWIPFCKALETLITNDSECIVEEQIILLPLSINPLKKLVSLTFNENPVPVDALKSLILSCSTLQEITFGWPEDCVQCGHPTILKLISENCPNLTKLGATIGKNEVPDLFCVLQYCRRLKILEIYGNGMELDVESILPSLSEMFSTTLGELVISVKWRFSPKSLRRFFLHAKNVPLYKLVVVFHEHINDDHLEVILNHSMDSLKYITFDNKKFFIDNCGILKASEWLRQHIVY